MVRKEKCVAEVERQENLRGQLERQRLGGGDSEKTVTERPTG